MNCVSGRRKVVGFNINSVELLGSITKSFIIRLLNPTNPPQYINTLNAELNPVCHLLALLGAHHILHVSGIRVNY